MAFQLNAILKFSSQGAEASLSRTQQSFANFQKSVAKTSQAMGQVGQAARAAATATAPFALGVGFAAKTAADFEQQMSKVQAAMLGTPEEMARITAVSKRLGATTAFTAKQAGEGAELLAQAGFSAEQIVQALPGVLDAAAASGVGLAEAADIVAGQIGAFGRAASDASVIADSLALVTAATNTNFTDLGEAMKYVAPIAKNAGLSIEETASSVGILANAGVKGSVAGTALKNAILQLAKPTDAAIELFGGRDGLAAATTRTVNGVKKLLPIEAIMANAAKAVAGARDPLEATAQVAEIFGLRGTTAFGAFQSKLLETTAVTDKNIDQLRKGLAKTGDQIDLSVGKSIPSLVALRLQIAGAEGTARQMAQIRLDNLRGQVEMLSSAAEGLFLEVGGLVTGPLKEGLKGPTDFLSVMAVAFQKARDGTALTADELSDLKTNQFGSLFASMQEFAKGFIEGFNEMREAAKTTFNEIAAFLKPILGETGLTAREFGRLAAKVIIVGAVAAPILGAIGVGLMVLGPIISGASALFSFMGTVIMGVGRVAGFAFRAAKFGIDLVILGVRNFGVVASFASRVASAAFGFLGTTLRLLGGIGGVVVRGLIMGFGFLGTTFAFIGKIAVAAFVGLKAVIAGVAIPLGIVLLKIAAIAAAIAGVIFLGDKLLRVFGFLEGPSLFERTLDFFSDFGTNIKKTLASFTGPGSALGGIKDFFTGGDTAKVDIAAVAKAGEPKDERTAKVIDFKAAADALAKRTNEPKGAMVPPALPKAGPAAIDPRLSTQLKTLTQELPLSEATVTPSGEFSSLLQGLGARPVDVQTETSLSPGAVQSLRDSFEGAGPLQPMPLNIPQVSPPAARNNGTPDLRDAITKGLSGSEEATLKSAASIRTGLETGLKRDGAATLQLPSKVSASLQGLAEKPGLDAAVLSGTSGHALQQGAGSPTSTPPTLSPEFMDTSIQSQRLAAESLKQKVISSPPSEEKIISGVRRSLTGAGPAAGPQAQSVRLTGELRTQISGRDLNIILSRAMLDNSEANGRSIDPVTKRRVSQNGLTFGVS